MAPAACAALLVLQTLLKRKKNRTGKILANKDFLPILLSPPEEDIKLSVRNKVYTIYKVWELTMFNTVQ